MAGLNKMAIDNINGSTGLFPGWAGQLDYVEVEEPYGSYISCCVLLFVSILIAPTGVVAPH